MVLNNNTNLCGKSTRKIEKEGKENIYSFLSFSHNRQAVISIKDVALNLDFYPSHPAEQGAYNIYR